MVADSVVKRLRHCLHENFTFEALRRLCYDTETFKPVYNRLTADMSRIDLIDQLINYAEQESALAELEQLVGPCDQVRPAKRKIRAKPPRTEKVAPTGPRKRSKPSISISIGGSNQGAIIAGDHNTVENQIDEDEDLPEAE
jgi:hypothetical protein